MNIEIKAQKVIKTVRIDPVADVLLKVMTEHWNEIKKDDKEWTEVEVLEYIIIKGAEREGFKVKSPPTTTIDIETPKKKNS